jgi:integrase
MRTPQCERHIYLLANPSEEDPAYKDAGTSEIQKVSHRSMDRITGGSLMPIRKREFKNGAKWCVDVMLPNGKRYRRVVGVKKQAEQVQKRIESEIVEGKWEIRDKEDIPFSTLTIEYLEYAEANKATSTFITDKYRIEAHLLPYFGDTPISEISLQMIDGYKTSRVRKRAAPKTINNELVNLSHMMTMAARWGYINSNIVLNVVKLRVPKRNMRFLNQQEIQRLLNAASKSYIYPIIVTALHTGMRKSELFNLKWTDVDFEHQLITIQSNEDWHTKNYGARTLSITPNLYDVLISHHQQQLEMNIKSGYVFTYRGEKIKAGIKKSFITVLRDAGLAGVTLHTLRHTFASQLVMTGVPLRDIQELMGHESYETTLQYAHLTKDHAKQQVLRLPFAS